MFKDASRSSFVVHPKVEAAYTTLLTLGIPMPLGPALIVTPAEPHWGRPSWAVAGFGWLHIPQDTIPVLTLPAKTPLREIRDMAWREVAAQIPALSSVPHQRAKYLMYLCKNCPLEELELFGLPAFRDPTILRRKFGLRQQLLEPEPEPDVFAEAVRSLGLR